MAPPRFTNSRLFATLLGVFIKVTKKQNDKYSVRIVESVRRKGKTMQKTIRSLGVCPFSELEDVKGFAQQVLVKLKNDRHPALPGMAEIVYSEDEPKKTSLKKRVKRKTVSEEMFSLTSLQEKARIIHGLEGVCGEVYDKLGFLEIIRGTNKDIQWNEVLKACVLGRIADPVSKKKTVENLVLDYNQDIPLEKVYRMMDRLCKNIESVKAQITANTLKLFNHEVDVLFFDVTTLYFESFSPDELRNFGFSKDCKFKETQVVLALVTNSEGHPITYELFPGNTSEGSTLIEVIKNLKNIFKVRNIVLVADRAMFNRKNLDLMDNEGISYVVAAKLKTLAKIKREEILSNDYRPSVVSEELHWLKEFEQDNRRLIVSYSNKRAQKDAADRNRLVDRLLKKAKNSQIPLTSLIGNRGTKKFVKVEKTKAVVNDEKIKQDQLWDGLHGVISNIKDQSKELILERYRGLWKIEQAFRLNKNDLKMRPIYHWKKSRIEAHIAICFIAYSLSCHMNYTLKLQNTEMSFAKLKEHLKRDQFSLIEDQKTKKIFRVPSKNTDEIKAIYKAFGLVRETNIISI